MYPDQLEEPLPNQLTLDERSLAPERPSRRHPPRSLTGSTRRLSIVLFTGPNADAGFTCIPSCIPPGETARHTPIVAGAHLKEKVRLTFGGT